MALALSCTVGCTRTAVALGIETEREQVFIVLAVATAFLSALAGYQYGKARGWSEIESRVKSPELFRGETWDEMTADYPWVKVAAAIFLAGLSGLSLLVLLMALLFLDHPHFPKNNPNRESRRRAQ